MKIEKYMLIFSEILLIVLSELSFYYSKNFYGFLLAVGVFVLWLIENDQIHLTVFWSLILTGMFFVLIGAFIFGVAIILIGVGELYLNDALISYHEPFQKKLCRATRTLQNDSGL